VINYYTILKVSPKATKSEIKSAYRRLAKELHPDLSSTIDTSDDFAQVAKAYKILGDKKNRILYDEQLANLEKSSNSVLDSENLHAQKLRQMVLEKHYNDIVDRMLSEERNEAIALQRFVFPLVALFVSTVFVAAFRPLIWTNSAIIGKIIVLTLFVVGLLHLFRRLKDGFQKFTYEEPIHESILDEETIQIKPYARIKTFTYIVFGLIGCVVLGFFIGNFLEMFIATMMPNMFSPTLKPEMIFYPPIVVLLVDLMHNLASKLDF
jgi:curved DNA-binding protein CbpA